jgi:hypothetical protein
MEYLFSFGFLCGAIYMAVFDANLRVQILIHKPDFDSQSFESQSFEQGMEKDLERGEE